MLAFDVSRSFRRIQIFRLARRQNSRAEQTNNVPLRDQLVMEQIDLARLKRDLEKSIVTTT